MGGEALWELVKVFLAALFASTLTHLLTHRRFIQGRWWDRKDKAYGDIISSLVGLIRSLEWQKRAEERWGTEPEYEPPEEVRKAVLGECKEARDRIERAVVEGDYVVTRKAANALAELVEALEVGLPKVGYWTQFWHWFGDRCEMAKSCLEFVRCEARSDLGVKWYSWF